MTSEEKVKKIYPDAICTSSPVNGIWVNCRPSKKTVNYQVFANNRKLSHFQPMESWAWAEAVRVLKGENKL